MYVFDMFYCTTSMNKDDDDAPKTDNTEAGTNRQTCQSITKRYEIANTNTMVYD